MFPLVCFQVGKPLAYAGKSTCLSDVLNRPLEGDFAMMKGG